MPEPTNRWIVVCAGVLAWCLSSPFVASGFRPPELTPQQEKLLRDNWALCKSKKKGPYTENYCLCGGKKLPVMVGTRISQPCANPAFCAAYRAPWAEALGAQRMWIANVFARDLYESWSGLVAAGDIVTARAATLFLFERQQLPDGSMPRNSPS